MFETPPTPDSARAPSRSFELPAPDSDSPAAAVQRALPPPLPRRWRSMWLADVRLGASECRAPLLLGLLRHFESEHFYLAGDVFAGGEWDAQRWDPAHGAVVRALVERANRSHVVYVTGADDGFVRRHAGRALGSVDVREEAVHQTADGRRLLVLHRPPRIEAEAASARGDANKAETLDLSRRSRRSIYSPTAQDVDGSERELVGEALRRGVDGVVCGLAGRTGIRTLDGVLLCSAGDWVGSCSALVEDARGKLAVLRLSAVGAG